MSFDAYTNSGQGQNLFQPLVIQAKRDPVNGVDLSNPGGGAYLVDQKWLNTVSENYWRYQGGGIWVQDSGNPGPLLKVAVPQGTSPVTPDINGQMTFTSGDGSVIITGSTNTIDFQSAGGSAALNSLDVDTHTAPGTDPVLPLAGVIGITGGTSTLANGTFATGTQQAPIRTNSIAANTFNIQAQFAGSNASSASNTKYGVAQFDANQFTVTNGFVSITGGVPSATTFTVDASTAPGTNPVTTNAGNVTIEGGATYATGTRTNPIRTNSLAANTMDLQIQLAGSNATTAATNKFGVAQFDSTQFTVTSGFVQLVGSGSPITSVNVDAATAPGTNPVVPSGGAITIEGGATYATGTRAKPIRVNSLAANTMDLQIQLAGSNAGSATTNNFGVAQFDSNQFTVGSGFVQLKGTSTAAIQTITGDDTTAVAPNSSGNVNLLGNVVTNATHAKAVFTENSAANTERIDVQVAAAIASTDVTKVGLAAFDSSQFSVDANGFVTVNNVPNPSTTVSLYDDFITSNPNSSLGWVASGTSQAGVRVNRNQVAGHPGIMTLGIDGSGGAVAVSYALANIFTNGYPIISGAGVTTMTFCFSLTALTVFDIMYIGFHNGNGSNVPTFGVYFSYINGVNSNKWVVQNVNGGTTSVNTNSAVDTNFHRFTIIINAAGTTSQFLIDGVDVGGGVLSGNIPTGLYPNFHYKGGSGTNPAYLDFFTLNIALTTPR